MRYLLFASHGKLAEGILDSVVMITGKHDNIFVINAYKNEQEDLNKQLASVLHQIKNEDELIIVTDIFGGSVNNECLKLLTDTKIHLVAGLNLPLVIELVTRIHSNIETEQLIHSALHNAKKTMLYCNKVIEKQTVDEDF